jgi:hypothetical protein
MGLETNTYWLTDRQSQCDFDFEIVSQSTVSECGGIQLAVFRVEAGPNTSTVTLRVVGGEEKGSLKSETVKYCRESQGTRTRERLRWQGPAAYTKDTPVHSSERTSHKSMTVIVK